MHRVAVCDLTIRTSDQSTREPPCRHSQEHQDFDVFHLNKYSRATYFRFFTLPFLSFFALTSLVCLGLTNRNLHARCVHSYKTVESEGIEPPSRATIQDVTAFPTLRYTSPFSRVFPRCPSLLEIPFYLLLHQGLCTHTTT